MRSHCFTPGVVTRPWTMLESRRLGPLRGRNAPWAVLTTEEYAYRTRGKSTCANGHSGIPEHTMTSSGVVLRYSGIPDSLFRHQVRGVPRTSGIPGPYQKLLRFRPSSGHPVLRPSRWNHMPVFRNSGMSVCRTSTACYGPPDLRSTRAFSLVTGERGG